MNTIPRINLQEITKLPLQEIIKSEGVGKCIVIKTPHKGNKVIDYEEEVGMFTRKNKDKLFTKVISQIIDLEEEAKDYLLDKWIKDL